MDRPSANTNDSALPPETKVTDHEIPTRTTGATSRAGQGLVDNLLADIAIRIQLSPTQHRLATERYEALDQWIQRTGSPLYSRVESTYAQGSMRIGTTITSQVTDDEFDIDAVTQLGLAANTAPPEVLSTLFEAVRGKPGSRYFGCTRLRGRCVTVSYGDGMHVDLTPAILQVDALPRQSWIFEHKLENKVDPGRRLIANPYGFAEWFKRQVPHDHDFTRWFLSRAEAYESRAIICAEPVPPPEPVEQKSRAVVALQLIKRWRNVQYDERTGRRPPSVVLSKLVGDTAAEASSGGSSLLQVLLHLAQALLARFEHAHAIGQLIHVANPVCPADVLTDRWPGVLQAQVTFIDDLRNLVADLQTLQRSADIEETRSILVRLFGEAPASKVIENHLATLPRGPVRVTSTGAVSVGTAAAVHAVSRPVPRHTFHGDAEAGA